jgi:molybdopterin converting factor subunit 1
MATVRVLYFAQVRERLGFESEQRELPDQATPRELLARLAAAHPQAGELLARCRLAVDCTFAGEQVTLAPGSEVAVIPPVSGG